MIIIFDLHEVLIEGYKDTCIILANKYNMKPENLGKIMKERFTELMEGKLTEDEYFKDLITKVPNTFSQEEVQNEVRNSFTKVEKDTLDILKELHKKQYTLYLLSDHVKEWAEHSESIHDFLQLFKKRFYSFNIGKTKKDKYAFEHLLKDINKKPEECLFIDDSKRNIEIAKNLGINTIHYTSPIKLKKELKELNLLD